MIPYTLDRSILAHSILLAPPMIPPDRREWAYNKQQVFDYTNNKYTLPARTDIILI